MPATLYLKPRRAKPLFMRHPWVFSGAVRRLEGAAEKGDLVRVADEAGRFIAWGFYNPESQIRARLMTWDEGEAVDATFWASRIRRAARLREETLRLPERADAWRLFYSESDGASGLIVDKYGDYLVCQFHSAGLVRRAREIVDALASCVQPKGVLDASDERMLAREGVPRPPALLYGEAPPERLELRDGELRFVADLASGQKTGWFLDQRDNRWAAAEYARGRRVLDVFSYTGGFALAALARGAADAVCIERSEKAVDLLMENARLNGQEGLRFAQGDAAKEMARLGQGGERFGMVVLDPPKFARSRADLSHALEGYRKINAQALALLEEDGILVTCSCSQHVREEDLLMAVNQAAVETGRSVQVLERRGQAADHPVAASCAETGYLKCFICRAGGGE